MDEILKIQKELRLLKTWAVLSTVLLATFILAGAGRQIGKARLDEIDTQRINIVGSDGKLRLTI